jgi:hypothetical protein
LELQGGKIEINSTLNKGTTISVYLEFDTAAQKTMETIISNVPDVFDLGGKTLLVVKELL